MKIVVKESDKLKSLMHKDKFVSEYLIYLMSAETAVKCFIVYGDEAKKEKINDLLLTYFVSDNWNENKINLSEVLTEVDFGQFIKQN